MKKFFIYITVIISLIFLIPVLFTVQFKSLETINYEKIAEPLDATKYTYKEYGKIKVLNADTGIISEYDIDEYLLGVVSAEMPASYDIEALKAQAVVARTYTVYTIINNKNKHGDGVICTSSSCCQAWISKEDRLAKWDDSEKEQNWSKIEEAVNSTKGEVIKYNGQVIDAFFHSNSGGKTEIPANVWGGMDYPYLQVVETSGEDGYLQYSSEVCITKNEFESKMKNKYKDFSIDWNVAEPIKIVEHTDSGRIKTIKIGNKNLSGVEVRSIFELKSANFTCNIEDNKVKFSVKGYGHGVGLSQTGADSMAKNGANYNEIIKHFYTNVEIVSM